MATQHAAARPTADPTEPNDRDRRFSTPGAPAGPTEDAAPLRAAHTANFPALLRQLGASLLVTTYQAGKLVMVRDEGDHLNTHFRVFQAPMGMALDGKRGSRRACGFDRRLSSGSGPSSAWPRQSLH